MKSRKKSESIFTEMEEVAYRLFSEVRHETGRFQTGVCELKGKKILFMNNNQSIEERISALAGVISNQNMDEIYMKPVVRAEIEHQLEMLNKTADIYLENDGQ